jgi:hypothetical protein
LKSRSRPAARTAGRMASKRQRHRRAQRRTARRADGGVPIGEPGAPVEGSDAGDAADLHEQHRRASQSRLRADVKRRFETAKRLADQAPAAAEAEARRAIGASAKAFWRAEETEYEDREHDLMHELGRWTRQTFGCSVSFDGKEYKQRCPIAIAHKRLGFSIAFVADRICSICGGDLSECPHLRQRAYWVRGGIGPSGQCPVCLSEQGCSHRNDHLYRVSVVSIIREIRELPSISLVSRPAMPEARLTELPISNRDLVRSLGQGFRPGMPLSCDECLRPCTGFGELPADLGTEQDAEAPEETAPSADPTPAGGSQRERVARL